MRFRSVLPCFGPGGASGYSQGFQSLAGRPDRPPSPVPHPPSPGGTPGPIRIRPVPGTNDSGIVFHTMPSTFSNLLCHIVFSTKNRISLIEPGLQEPLYAYMGGILRNDR